MRRVLDNPWVGRAGNLVFLAGAIQSGIRLLMGFSLNVVGVVLFAAGLVLMASPHLVRRRKQGHQVAGDLAPQHTSLGTASQRQHPGRIYGGAAIGGAIRRQADQEEKERTFQAVEGEIALASEEAMEMTRMLRAEWPHITPDGAVVQTALPSWRAKTTEFIGAVLGSAQRSAFKGSGIGDDELKRLESEGKFLSDLALNLSSDSVRIGEQEVLEARRTRRTHEAASFLEYNHMRVLGAPTPSSLADQLDDLIREGVDLLDELMAPAQAEETRKGVWGLEFGDAPAEWWDKADAFYKQIKSLLTAEHPALLSDFERGYNERLRIEREREEVAPQRPDSRSDAQKVLDFATDTQRTPAKIVEACLEGLSFARKAI